MKKMLAMLLCWVLLSGAIPVYAEGMLLPEELTTSELTTLYGNILSELGRRSIKTTQEKLTDSEILFRGIPWGVSATQYVELMREQGINCSISDTWNCYSWEFTPSGGELEATNSMSDAGYTCNASSLDVKVGGYNIRSIEADFLYTYDADNVYTGEDKSSFYRAIYYFDVVDPASTFEILRGKLSSLYGEGVSEKTSTGYWSTGGDFHEYSEWTVWYGHNDTGVVLWRNYQILDSDGSVKKDSVRLQYGKTNSLIVMAELEAAQAREELEEAMNPSDVNGL